MFEEKLIVALSCGRLPGILDITETHSFVVFGTMDEKVLAGLTEHVADGTVPSFPIYFYETG